MPTPIGTDTHHQQAASKDPFPFRTRRSKKSSVLNNTDNHKHLKYITAGHHHHTQSRTTYTSNPVPRNHRSQERIGAPLQHRDSHITYYLLKKQWTFFSNPASTMRSRFCTHLHVQLQLKRLITALQPNHSKRSSSTWQTTQSPKLKPLPLVDKSEPATTRTERMPPLPSVSPGGKKKN